jgi:hypothetical protein
MKRIERTLIKICNILSEGLFALRAHPFGVALKGDRRRCAASSNPIFMSGVRPISVFGAKSQWNIFLKKDAG